MQYDVTLRSVIDDLAARGDAPAVMGFRRDEVEQWSYAQLAETVDRLARGLQERGVQRSEQVALVAPNEPAWIAAMLACGRAGVVPVPIDVQFPREVLQHVLRDADAKLIVTTQSKWDEVRELDLDAPPEPVLLDVPEDHETSWHRLAREEDETRRATWARPGTDDIAVLFYTSGTTGPPRGVPLTHTNLDYQLHIMREANVVHEGERVLLPLPLHHVYPFVLGMLVPLSLGLTIVLPRSLTGQAITQAIREGEVNAVIGVPRLYRALLRGVEARVETAGRLAQAGFRAVRRATEMTRPFVGHRAGRVLLQPLHRQLGPSLRLLASGGSPLKEQAAHDLQAMGWQLVTGYGLTETAPMLAWNLPGESRLGSAGRPVPGTELRIDPAAAPEAERGESAEHDESAVEGAGEGEAQRERKPEVGEVLARGPGVFRGYRHLPDKTDESFTDDGFFRTGDLGYFDDAGFLHIIGRVSTMIVTESGENVQPDTMEEAYAEHPAIREVGVLQRDDQVVALVVPEAGATREGNGDEHKILRDALNERSKELPSYQHVSDFAITHEPLPRTRLGKLRRHKLEERYEQAAQGEEPGREARGPMPIGEMSGEDRALLDAPAAREAWNWLAERYPRSADHTGHEPATGPGHRLDGLAGPDAGAGSAHGRDAR